VSVPVDVAELGKALTDYGAGFLLSTTDGRIKVVTVEPEVRADGVLVVHGPGRGSSANISANPQVTLVFPPLAPRGFTLLVDGTATVDGDNAVITPSGAVLHRPAAHADGPVAGDGCGHDCAPIS
jgi:hypothetical protein